MKITLYLSVKRREQELRSALVSGFTKHGDTVRSKLRREFGIDWQDNESDLVVFCGVKSRKLWNICMANSRKVLLLDKGYFGRADYYRTSVGGYQPPYVAEMAKDNTRLSRLMGIRMHPRRAGGHTVLYAGSSNKYCLFHGLGNVTEYAMEVCGKLNDTLNGAKGVVYRPKPSWWGNDDNEIPKLVPPRCRLSPPTENFQPLLHFTHCLVTHGSNAAVEALCNGVPVVLTSEAGISPVYDLCEHDMANILKPFWPTDAARQQRMNNLAWCQYSINEIASGYAWENLKPYV